METVCNVCDGTEFTVNAGFYYCDNCGARATVLQEVEDQADGQFVDVKQKSHKIKQIAQTQNTELTSWETYNFILHGFVNELVQLGCKDELVLSTLQLWSAYLRKNEVAFFGKKETILPKFSFKYNQRDARLIYNLPMKRRATSSAVSSAGSGEKITHRQSKMALRKTQKSLATAQYEEYMSSQKTDISSVGLNLSQRSSTGQSSDYSDATIRIKYSRRARRKASQKIPRKHVLEHQNDIGRKLKCHNYKDKEVLGRSFVFAIIWLALNQIGDSLQISDLIRYAKESHIRLNDISSFMPPNIDSAQAVNHFRNTNDNLTHAFLRTKALTVAHVIGIRNVEQPDLAMLCERYCNDLSLPSEIAEIVKRLLAFHPPQMKTTESSALSRTVPNFEGRAMAYIIFVLKLFFGLDDKREIEISSSAQVINDKLNANDSKHSPLFVWSEWVEYIEMRNIILSQCHYPSAMQINPNRNMHTGMYIDFLKHNKEDSAYQEKYRKVEMENIRLIFDQIVQLHEQHDRHEMRNSCYFPHTLTPFSSYMEQVLNDRSIKSKIYIPEFMTVNHEKRNLMPYLKPKILKNILKEINLPLKVKEIGFNQESEFAGIHYENSKTTSNVKFEFDLTRAQWIDLMKECDEKENANRQQKRCSDNKNIIQTVNEHLSKLQCKQAKCESTRKANVETDKNTDIMEDSDLTKNHPVLAMPSYSYFDEEDKDIVDEILLNEPRRNLDNQTNMLNYQSSDDDESIDSDTESTDSIEFVTSNFDYWIAMQNIYYITNASFDASVNTLPKTFQWLLKQCALQLHMHIKDLYIELLAIENQYRYVLKPIFKMDNYIKYRAVQSRNLDAKTINAIKNLRRIW